MQILCSPRGEIQEKEGNFNGRRIFRLVRVPVQVEWSICSGGACRSPWHTPGRPSKKAVCSQKKLPLVDRDLLPCRVFEDRIAFGFGQKLCWGSHAPCSAAACIAYYHPRRYQRHARNSARTIASPLRCFLQAGSKRKTAHTFHHPALADARQAFSSCSTSAVQKAAPGPIASSLKS